MSVSVVCDHVFEFLVLFEAGETESFTVDALFFQLLELFSDEFVSLLNLLNDLFPALLAANEEDNTLSLVEFGGVANVDGFGIELFCTSSHLEYRVNENIINNNSDITSINPIKLSIH